MVESGDIDTAIGPAGEVSRFQITPAVWRQFTCLPMTASRNPVTALNVAKAIMTARVASFGREYHRAPSDIEWYLLWHRPAIFLSPVTRHPSPAERARAQRFDATVRTSQPSP